MTVTVLSNAEARAGGGRRARRAGRGGLRLGLSVTVASELHWLPGPVSHSGCGSVTSVATGADAGGTRRSCGGRHGATRASDITSPSHSVRRWPQPRTPAVARHWATYLAQWSRPVATSGPGTA